MNNLMKLFRKLSAPSTFKDCLNSVKSKFGAVGDAIYREPGVMVFQKKGSNDVLRMSFYDNGGKIGSRNCHFNIETLIPLETTYKQYMSRVGEQVGYLKTRNDVGPHHIIGGGRKVILKVSPERYTNRCGEGGLSRMYTYNNRQYFCPSTQCTI